ncbi:unnamed protein product, partial [Symbiodinium necroappetens]
VSSALQERTQTAPAESPRCSTFGIERDAIGGAMSVKLVSWAEPLKLTPVPVDLVERNAKILKDLYQSARVHLPPQMEWMFLANLIQQYTGPVEEIFDQVTFYESKQQVYWKHHLKKYFTTKPTDPAVHRYTLLFAHGTNSGGAEGIINSRYLAPATLADGPSAVGGQDAQQACMIHAAVHFKRDRKWLLHSDLTTVSSVVIAVRKQFQPRRDKLGRPLFHLGIQSCAHVFELARSVAVRHHVATLGFSFEDSSQVPSQRQSTQEWDTTKLYGLTLPKHVVVSGGVSNWALRQVAHGRTVQWENFRSRQEAIFCGVMTRALRSEQAEQEGSDFVTILNSCQKKFHPESDLHDWNARYNTIKRLADDLVKEFRKKAPVQANQTLLMRLQSLESENARLKGLEDPDGPFDKDSQPLAAEATSIRNVNSWLASTALGKGKNRAIDTAVDEVVAACSKLDDGQKKPVDRIAVDWGLSVGLAAKLSEKCLIRLIAGEVRRIVQFIVTTERVNFPPLHLPSFKMVEVKILPASPLADLNLNDTTFLPEKQWQRTADKGADQQDLSRQVWRDLKTLTGTTFNVLSVQQAIRVMWRSMMNHQATEPVVMIQQALDFTLMLLQDKWGQPWQQQSVQVSLRNKDPHLRVFRGQRRFAARQTKTLHLEDLPSLVAASSNVVTSLFDRYKVQAWVQLLHPFCVLWWLPLQSIFGCIVFVSLCRT